MKTILTKLQLQNSRLLHKRTIRVNEPERYQSRCKICGHGKFDVTFESNTLFICDVTCASPQCNGEAYLDHPSGFVWKSVPIKTANKCAVGRCFSSHTTKKIDDSKPKPTKEAPRKRGRPPGSKNKKGTKKSRQLMAQQAMLQLQQTDSTLENHIQPLLVSC